MKMDQYKEQVKELKNRYKNYFKTFEGYYRKMEYPSFTLPSRISEIQAKQIYSEMFCMFYKAERKKLFTSYKNKKQLLGFGAFNEQKKFIINNPSNRLFHKGFTRDEVIEILNEVSNDV